ncbi:hypothetical protein [Baekduia sp. Peel2402]|uniref:hypothetical protein n=1 Tax=Baekduia sp. Peel2402 TaxID=3458296 RepID=UPI00403E3FB0
MTTALALAVLLAASALAATVAPNSTYAGRATYADGKTDFRLRTSLTGRRVIVVPGYYRLAQHCSKKWRGTVSFSELQNRHWITVAEGGRFTGTGRGSWQPLSTDPATYVARWTVKGRFTSATTARGTIRITVRTTRGPGGPTTLSCPTETAKWSTTDVSPLGPGGSGRG